MYADPVSRKHDQLYLRKLIAKTHNLPEKANEYPQKNHWKVPTEMPAMDRKIIDSAFFLLRRPE